MDIYDEILTFWFPDDEYHKWWVISNKKLDQKIFNNYYKLLIDTYENFNIDNYKEDNFKKILIDIIILDQFSRNINRILNNINIFEFTKKALLLSYIWIDRKYYLIYNFKYSAFAFLPIRHQFNYTLLLDLLKLLNDIEQDNKHNKIFIKFKFHTQKSLLKLL